MDSVALRYKSVNSIETISFRPIMSILKLIYSLRPKKWAIAQVSTPKFIFSHSCTDHCAFGAEGGGLKIFRFRRKFFGLVLDPWSLVGQMTTSVTWFRCILGHPIWQHWRQYQFPGYTCIITMQHIRESPSASHAMGISAWYQYIELQMMGQYGTNQFIIF